MSSVPATPRRKAIDGSSTTRATRSAPRPSPDPRRPPIKVLCVDDHPILVGGLKAQFAIDGHLRVVGELTSAEDLLGSAARLEPEIVLLDIEMPGPDAFEIADRLRHVVPNTRVVILSAHVRDGYLAAAYACGAWGYFAKGDELEDIVAGIREVARSVSGTFVMGPMVRERCGASRLTTGRTRRGDPSAARDKLTAREIEVLHLIGLGLSRREIAAQLCRSAKTVDGHQERLIRKLGVSSRAELMRFAIREGFAEA